MERKLDLESANIQAADRGSAVSTRPAIVQPGVLGPRIALDYGAPVKHKSPIFREGHQSFVIVGRSGCGKTTLVLSLIPHFARLQAIVYCTRIPNTDIFSAIGRWCSATMRDTIPPDELQKIKQRVYEDATAEEKEKIDRAWNTEEKEGPESHRIRFHVANTPDEFNKIITPIADSQRFGRMIGYHTLCIFDDFRSRSGTESDPYVSCAIMANCTLRNFGCFTIWMTQQYSKLTPTTLRANCNNLIAFGMSDKYARETLLRDFSPLEQRFGRDGVRALYDDVCIRPHAYLWMILKGNNADLYRYEDDSTGLQRVESSEERNRRRYGELDTLGGTTKAAMRGIMRDSRLAKLREMQAAHDVLLRCRNDAESRRLAAVLWTRIWALAEKIGAQEGRSPEGVLS